MVEGASIDKQEHIGRRRARDLGRHRVRSRRRRRARLRAPHQQRRRPRQRHAGDRHRRPRDRRPGAHRRRQRALRAQGAGPGRARLRRGLPLRAGSGDARLLPELPARRAGLSRRSGSDAQAAAWLGGRTRSLRELARQPAPACSRPSTPRASEVDGRIVAVPRPATANPARDGSQDDERQRRPPHPGVPRHGQLSRTARRDARRDSARPTPTPRPRPMSISGHTASDVPLSASGPGALTFTGTYDNTDVFGEDPEADGRKVADG